MFHFIVVETVRRISNFLDIYGFSYPKVAAVFTFPLMCWKPLVISPIVFSCVLYGCLKHFKILRVKVNIFVIIWPFRECVSTGAAGTQTRRSLGYHLLHPLILRLLVLCAPVVLRPRALQDAPAPADPNS